jgi:hypothetical protein
LVVCGIGLLAFLEIWLFVIQVLLVMLITVAIGGWGRSAPVLHVEEAGVEIR